jgi:threonine dehydrogenase-like Zn-dependent dehydrogenase
MRALALDFESRSLGWRGINDPEFVDGRDVLFRVHEVGVCGTDRALAAFRLGRPPEGESHLVLGHEALGQILEVGRAVESLNKGDWVVPTVRRACRPPCASCRRRRRDLCISGRYTERGILGAHGYFTERAVDREDDLVRVPPGLIDLGILIEPLSVAEKAIARAISVHEGEPRSALVLGAGPIGMLTAMALNVRGYEVRVHSREPANHPRAALLGAQNIGYEPVLTDARADIIIEATGSAELALAVLGKMTPLAVMVVLGADEGTGSVPFLRMILNNQTIVGSVNADAGAFRAALEDLARFDRRAAAGLISRIRFSDLERSVAGPPLAAAKVVHVLPDPLH